MSKEKWWQKALRKLLGIDFRPRFPSVPDIAGGDDEGGSGGGVSTSCRHEHLDPGVSAGGISIETNDMQPKPDRNDNGGWEYGVISLYGRFGRVLLMQLGGGRKCLRFKVGTTPMQLNIHHDNLPGWHTWAIVLDGRRIWVELDGRRVGNAQPFGEIVSDVYYAGMRDRGRELKGQWRNGEVQIS